MSIEPQNQKLASDPFVSRTRLLIVLPALPWPLRQSGISVRFAPIIGYLSARHWLDVLVLDDGESTSRGPPPTLQFGSIEVLPVPTFTFPVFLRKALTLWRGLTPNGEPFGFIRHINYSELEFQIATRIRNGSYATVLWAAGHLAMACRLRAALPTDRFVIDVVDSPTLRCLRDATASPLIRGLRPYNVWKWRRLERRAQDSFDATIYISPVDATTANKRSSSNTCVIPNGFTELRCHRDPADANNATIGFLGDMSYPPNISAALRLAKRIFPSVHTILPDAKLLIIGRNPSASIQALKSPEITVTGTVDDIGPYLAKVTVFVFPMIEGAGLQNKILDAMCAGVPVVTTPIAAASLGAVSGNQLLIGETDRELARHALEILRDPDAAAELSRRGHAFTTHTFSWNSLLPSYERLLLSGVPPSKA